MDLTNEELKATRKNIGYEREMSLYEMELREKKRIKELKLILHEANLTSDWRETIEDVIKMLGGE